MLKSKHTILTNIEIVALRVSKENQSNLETTEPLLLADHFLADITSNALKNATSMIHLPDKEKFCCGGSKLDDLECFCPI